jgi:NAD(P)-dependent dehydrogenase (short-subunit alcohol dehydrogenase family)
MARDLSRVGIRVNTILPGTMGTPMTKMMDPDQGAKNAVGQGLKDATPFPKRFGYPDEFAGLACHIIENGFLNGESIRLDGAIRMPKI